MLAAGDRAPTVSLPDVNGGAHTLADMFKPGAPEQRSVLVVFYKVGCPICQLTLPYIERISHGELQLVNISQDHAPDTKRFMSAFGISMLTLLDSKESGYPVSNAFGITHVPSLFLVEPDGVIAYAGSGFNKAQLEALAALAGSAIFRPEDNVPAWKAG